MAFLSLGCLGGEAHTESKAWVLGLHVLCSVLCSVDVFREQFSSWTPQNAKMFRFSV